jgi:hypothetical protein
MTNSIETAVVEVPDLAPDVELSEIHDTGDVDLGRFNTANAVTIALSEGRGDISESLTRRIGYYPSVVSNERFN